MTGSITCSSGLGLLCGGNDELKPATNHPKPMNFSFAPSLDLLDRAGGRKVHRFWVFMFQPLRFLVDFFADFFTDFFADFFASLRPAFFRAAFFRVVFPDVVDRRDSL